MDLNALSISDPLLENLINELSLNDLLALFSTNLQYHELFNSRQALYWLFRKYNLPVVDNLTFDDFIEYHNQYLVDAVNSLSIDDIETGQKVVMYNINHQDNFFYFLTIIPITMGDRYVSQLRYIINWSTKTKTTTNEIAKQVVNYSQFTHRPIYLMLPRDLPYLFDLATISRLLLRKGYNHESVTYILNKIFDNMMYNLSEDINLVARYVYLASNAYTLDSKYENLIHSLPPTHNITDYYPNISDLLDKTYPSLKILCEDLENVIYYWINQ